MLISKSSFTSDFFSLRFQPLPSSSFVLFMHLYPSVLQDLRYYFKCQVDQNEIWGFPQCSFHDKIGAYKTKELPVLQEH